MARQVPEVLLVIEGLRIEHVIGAVDLGLHAEQRLRVARVAPQVRRHLRGALEQVGEEALVGRDDRVVGREDVQVRLAVVGIHGGLHGIADVVDAAHIGDVHAARE